MPTAPTLSRDHTLEAHVFWYRFRTEIVAVIVLAVLAGIIFAGYRLYSMHRESAAAESLGKAEGPQEYRQLIADYGSTDAGATAYLLLAQAQRKQGKFAESNATLQAFVDKNPHHDFVATARMAMAANLESMGKMDEALATYQRAVADYPHSFEAPVALISQVRIFKLKKQTEAARRACEAILTDHRDSIWAGEAMRELRSLKPSAPASSAAGPGVKAGSAPTPPRLLARPQGAPAPSAPPSAKPK